MIRDEIEKLIAGAIVNVFGGNAASLNFSVERPEKPEYGDYSTNAALVLAKIVKKNPLEIAATITDDLRFKNPDLRIDVALQGFINFWLSDKILQKEFQKILKDEGKYGSNRKNLRRAQGKKVQIEFISANPTGPLTLANGRGGFLGDVLSNVLEFRGHKIEREYYVNDTGNQILTLGKSILAANGLRPEEENFYKGEYVKKWAGGHKSFVKKNRNEPLKVGQAAAKDFLASIKKVIRERARIKFNRFTSEDAHIHKKGLVKKTMDIFRKAGKVYEKDGALWLKTSDFGDDKDRVLVTGDKFPTYFLADSAHYLETKKRDFDEKINILGPDHYGYVKRIQVAAEFVGLKNSKFIVTQAIRLVREGKEAKMSKRRGEFVTFEDLIGEVGLDVARYFFLERSPDTHVDFDLDLAKERSVKNPVYYIQYAYVRCRSILQKAKSQRLKIKTATKSPKPNLLNAPEELLLIKKLVQFPEVVEDIAGDYQVHRLPRYALELARLFHNFYEKRRVITDDKELSRARLALVAAAQIVFENTLDLMGIDAPQKM